MMVDMYKHTQPTRKQQQQQLRENAIVPQRDEVVSEEDAISCNLWVTLLSVAVLHFRAFGIYLFSKYKLSPRFRIISFAGFVRRYISFLIRIRILIGKSLHAVKDDKWIWWRTAK